MISTKIDFGSQELRDFARKTVFYSRPDDITKAKSLSSIKIFKSGANRIKGKPHEAPPQNELKRHKNDIYDFSYGARKRYFEYCSSLNFDNLYAYCLDVTLSTTFESYIDKEKWRSIVKSFFKYLIKQGFDYVYKLEFTEKEIPHLHIIIYSAKDVHHSASFNRIEISRHYSQIWSDCCFDRSGLCVFLGADDDLLRTYKHMSVTSAFFKVPKDIKKTVYYLAYYFTKNKEYQNIIPNKYLGLKMWGYGRENYGKIKETPIEIDITREMFDLIFERVKKTVEANKKKECALNNRNCKECDNFACCGMLKKNGLYSLELDKILNEFHQACYFDNMHSEGEYYQKLIDKFNDYYNV